MKRLALAAVVLFACDSSKAPSIRDQAKTVAEAACAAAFACDCDNPYTDDYDDEAACVEGVGNTLVDRALDDVGLSFNAACVDRVATALQTFGCETPDEAAASGPLFAAAEQLRECRLFIGTAGAGESCERLGGGIGDSCDADHFCDAGTCAAVGEGGFESSCGSDSDCQRAYRCRTSSEDMTMRCLDQPGVGDPCSLAGDCSAGAYCSTAGTCSALPGPGQSCTVTPSQDGLVCAPGSACANGVCQAGAAQGEPCGVTCAEGLACEGGFCIVDDAAVCAYELDAV